jgi:hypothetical protein
MCINDFVADFIDYEAAPNKDIRTSFSAATLAQIQNIEEKMLEFHKTLQEKTQGFDEWVAQQGEASDALIYRITSEIRQLHSENNTGLSQRVDDAIEALEDHLFDNPTHEINKLAKDMYNLAAKTLTPLEASALVMYAINIVRDKTT